MNKGFRSRFVSDALTRRQLYVERAKTALHDEHDNVSRAVLAALLLALGNLNTRKFGTITKAELRKVVRGVLEKYDLASARYLSMLTTWLEDFSNQESEYAAGVMNNALEDEDQAAPIVWPFVAAGIIAATGLTPKDTLKGLRTKQRAAIQKLIQRAYVMKWSADDLLKAFKGTSLAKYKDGLLSKLKRAAAATVDTVVQYGMTAARSKTLAGFMDWTLGYTWVSILDGRTSPVCRSLSGQVFKYGAGPLPPIHFRCRSHTEPVFKNSSVLRKAAQGTVAAGETYYTWLARQPKAFQEDVLGPTWSKLFSKGGLSADEFAAKVVSKRYEPLTLDELRARSPEIFARAGV